MRYYRTTGLILSQTQELVRRINETLVTMNKPWSKATGRKRAAGLYLAVQIACMYIRQNISQETLGDLHDVSQPTVSRIVKVLVPMIKSALKEFVPDPEEAIELVDGRACLVDGTIAPCWSYEEHEELWSRKRGTTGFNAQLISLLDGTPVYISDPLDGNVHDAKAFNKTSVATIITSSGGAIGDKGYQGCANVATPKKTPPRGGLSKNDKESNSHISSLRAPVERFVAHFKSWKVFFIDFRRPYRYYRETFDAGRALFFFSITWGFE